MSPTIYQQAPLSRLTESYLIYAEAELGLARQTREKYRDCLRQVARILGDRPVSCYSRADVLELKADLVGRELSIGRQLSILAAFKSLLAYARGEWKLHVMDPAEITFP